MTIAGSQKQAVWPSCILPDYALRRPTPVFADVRPFISHTAERRHREVTYNSEGTIGMVLRDEPHDLGEVVDDILPNSQAADAGVQKGWIIVQVNGKPFSPTERLTDVGEDFKHAKEGAVLKVKYDIRTFFDCAQRNCAHSDKFPADTPEQCAEACAQVPACQWWSFESEDGDAECAFQASTNGSFVPSRSVTTAPRACVPTPKTEGSAQGWPACIVKGAHILAKDGEPLFTDVRPFITHPDDVRHRLVTFESKGNIGMVLQDQPHQDGELVSNVLEGSQAWSAGVRKGWIINEVDGKPFRKGEELKGVGVDFSNAKIFAPLVLVKFDVRTSLDCTDGNCLRSDKLPAASEAVCAEVCGNIPGCGWWSFGSEDEDHMCWLRRSGKGMLAAYGFSSGMQACGPSRYSWLRLCIIVSLLAAAAYYREMIFPLVLGLGISLELFSLIRTVTCRLGLAEPVMEMRKLQGGCQKGGGFYDDDI